MSTPASLPYAFVAKIVAADGQHDAVADLLAGAVALANEEVGTIVWFAVRTHALLDLRCIPRRGRSRRPRRRRHRRSPDGQPAPPRRSTRDPGGRRPRVQAPVVRQRTRRSRPAEPSDPTAAWSISLRTQRSLRRRTVDTSHVQVATQHPAALPSGARPTGARTGCRPRALSRRGVRRRGERRRCRAEP